MATYAVGDIQGCYDSFLRLLEVCSFEPKKDRLWLVGDLVNRGPQSLETLRHIRNLGDAAVSVLGNHDLYLLMMAYGAARKRGRGDTLQSILDAPDREDLLDWLRRQPLCHREGKYCMVHAGLLPQWTVAQAVALGREVQSALSADNFLEFIQHMWGSEPTAWSDELEGWPRLRVIVNAMTRMRFCTPDGVMEFMSKGEVSQAPAGHLPWFEAPGRKSADSVLVTGHWSALGFKLRPNLMALDSGCLWGNHLTAVCLEDLRIFQVPCSATEAQSVSPS